MIATIFTELHTYILYILATIIIKLLLSTTTTTSTNTITTDNLAHALLNYPLYLLLATGSIAIALSLLENKKNTEKTKNAIIAEKADV